MVRYMQDSTNGSQFSDQVKLPGESIVPVSFWAGYVGGSYEKSSHSTGKVNVNIDVDGTHPYADVLDIETGDATPDTAPGWVKAHNSQSKFPAILYCNRTVIHAVANYCAAAGLQVGKDFFWWIATLDGTKTVPDMTGVLAVQVWSANYFPGQNIDVSIVYNDSWKAAPVTQPSDNYAFPTNAQGQPDYNTAIRQIWEVLFGGGSGTPRNLSIYQILNRIQTALGTTPQ